VKTLTLLLFTLFFPGVVSVGAKPKDGSLILPPPEYSAWSITLLNKYGEDADHAAQDSAPALKLADGSVGDQDPVVKWNFKKVKDIMYVKCVTKDGKIGLVWIVNGMQVVQRPGQTSWFVNRHMQSSTDPFWLELGTNGFPHTTIVSPKTYQDTVDFMGKKCLHFKSQVHDPVEEDPARGNYDISVYIDEKSRLPVYAAGLIDAFTFEFSKLPKNELIPPPEVTNAVEAETKRRDRLDAVPPHA
jgi:hypothetical protein